MKYLDIYKLYMKWGRVRFLLDMARAEIAVHNFLRSSNRISSKPHQVINQSC